MAGKAGGFYIVGSGPSKVAGAEAFPVFENCVIMNNIAIGRGGGTTLDLGANALFVDCKFIGNECTLGKGGAIYNDFGCSSYFENCLFVNNKAESGGAFGNDGGSGPKLNNCTLFGNIANEVGAALYQGSGPPNNPTVFNSIVWGNVCEEDLASIYDWNECNTLVQNSLIEGGYVGDAVIDANPLFADADKMNFALQNGSPALTAGSDGGQIGFDKSKVGTRTEAEIEAILAKLKSLPTSPLSTPLDFSNPVTKAGALNGDRVIFVSPEGKGQGTSWKDASGSLQDAIDQANAAYTAEGEAVQIWVARGTYLPGSERKDSFMLRTGVELYGGFSGRERSLDQRNIAKNQTLLSGDIGVKGDLSDNAYHVLIGADNVLVDGFTISDGNADKMNGGRAYDNKGGAVLNYRAGSQFGPGIAFPAFSPTFKNCVFTNNHAVEGGVIFTFHGGNPVFDNCQFKDNSATYGGVSIDRAGNNSKYLNSTFENNRAQYKGGVLFVDYGAMATIMSCTFKGNSSGTGGGAIYVIDRASQQINNETDFDQIDPTWPNMKDIFSAVLVLDSNFEDNSAGTNGGAIYVYESSYAKVDGSSFKNNSAKLDGGAIGLFNAANGYISNTTFSGNNPVKIFKDDTSKLEVDGAAQ
jgi:hypothetical protein